MGVCVAYPFLRLAGLWPKAAPLGDMRGRVCVVTGSNTGVGLATAAGLARLGASVVMACRSVEKAQAAAERLEAGSPEIKRRGGALHVLCLDLADLEQVERFVADFSSRFDKLHVLVCNAGVPGFHGGTTAQGFEQAFGVSYLGHMALVRALLPTLQRTQGARVVTLASVMHWFGQRGATADWQMAANNTYPFLTRLWTSSYSDAKLAMVYMAAALRARGVHATAVNPGDVASDIWRYSALTMLLRPIMRLFFLTTEQGAVPSLHAAAAQPAPLELYYTPYFTQRWLPRHIELIGPFAGALSAVSKPEREGNVARDAERLWAWGEAVLDATARKAQ